MTKAIFSCAESNAFINKWIEARGDRVVPPAGVLSHPELRHLSVNSAVIGPDAEGLIAFKFMGQGIADVLGGNYTGRPAYAIFNAQEREEMDRLHALMFSGPVVVVSMFELPTLHGRRSVIEQVQAPERLPSGDLQYVVLISQAYEPLVSGDNTGGDAAWRKVLWRRVLNARTLETMDTAFSIPRMPMPEYAAPPRTATA